MLEQIVHTIISDSYVPTRVRKCLYCIILLLLIHGEKGSLFHVFTFIVFLVTSFHKLSYVAFTCNSHVHIILNVNVKCVGSMLILKGLLGRFLHLQGYLVTIN